MAEKKDDGGTVQVRVHGNIHHDGKQVIGHKDWGEAPTVKMDRARAAQLREIGHVSFMDDKEPEKPKLSILQHEGRPNDEPTPTPFPGDPVTPAPGVGNLERPEVNAELPVKPGETNPSPPVEGDVESPPPGHGVPETQPVEDPAERAAWKVKENRAPDDPGARPEDNYARHAIVSATAEQRVEQREATPKQEQPKHRGFTQTDSRRNAKRR